MDVEGGGYIDARHLSVADTTRIRAMMIKEKS